MIKGCDMDKRHKNCRVSAFVFVWVCAIFPAVCLISACRHESGTGPTREMFLERQTPGLVLNAGYAFEYEVQSCQKVVNDIRKTIRFQTDDQESYVNMVFDNWPAREGDRVGVKLDYSVSQRFKKMDLEMEVLKKEGENSWLWNDSSKTGLIIFLDK